MISLSNDKATTSPLLTRRPPVQVEMTEQACHSPDASEADAKRTLCHKLDQYVHEKIIASDSEIVATAVNKIVDNDVVLTYACSYVVEQILIEVRHAGSFRLLVVLTTLVLLALAVSLSRHSQANKTKKRFRVIVVDARPHYEGKELLRRLVKAGLDCTYVLLPSLSYVMKGVKKVLARLTLR